MADIVVNKSWFDPSSSDTVTLHSLTGDVTLPCTSEDTGSLATISFNYTGQWDYGSYNGHIFYNNKCSSFDEVPSNPSLIEYEYN